MKFTGIELADTSFKDLKSFLDDQDPGTKKRYIDKSIICDYISMAAVDLKTWEDDESHILALSALLTMMIVDKIDRVYF